MNDSDRTIEDIRAKASSRRMRAVALLLLIMAVILFAWRGPYKSTQKDGDFSVVYAAARTWLLGGNPYDYDQINETLDKAGAPGEYRPSADSLQSVYPPTTFITLLDISLLKWSWARPAMTIVNCIFLFAIIYLLIDLAGLPWRGPPAVFLAAMLVGFGPFHTTIWLGQLTIVALVCLVLAICFQHGGRPIAGGIFLGLVAAVKIHFGLPFIAYYLFRRKWTVGFSAILTFAILSIVAVIRLKVAGVDWMPSLQENINTMVSAGNNADPTAANPLRYQLINMQYLLHTFLDSRLLVSCITLVFVGVVALGTVYFIRGNTDPRRELLALSMVGVLDLLITYHRYYDAAIIAIAIGWAFAAFSTKQRLQSVIVIILSGVFLLPGSVILQELANRNYLPEKLTTSALWEVVIQPHQVWALLIMVCILFWALVSGREVQEE